MKQTGEWLLLSDTDHQMVMLYIYTSEDYDKLLKHVSFCVLSTSVFQGPQESLNHFPKLIPLLTES